MLEPVLVIFLHAVAGHLINVRMTMMSVDIPHILGVLYYDGF
jgi:hypothetical protein